MHEMGKIQDDLNLSTFLAPTIQKAINKLMPSIAILLDKKLRKMSITQKSNTNS